MIKQERSDPPTLVSRLGAVHDAVTGIGFNGAAFCTGLISVSFAYEVVARYFFSAPTEWATPVASYSMLAIIFLAMPELTRRASHVVINLFLDHATGTTGRALRAGIGAVAAAVCLFSAWFSADATLSQFAQGVWTNPPFAVPKWLISALIPYGMLSAGIYFLRQLFSDRAPSVRVETNL